MLNMCITYYRRKKKKKVYFNEKIIDILKNKKKFKSGNIFFLITSTYLSTHLWDFCINI